LKAIPHPIAVIVDVEHVGDLPLMDPATGEFTVKAIVGTMRTYSADILPVQLG